MIKKLVFVLFFFFFFDFVFAWSYPLRQVSKPIAKCKFNLWKNLWSDCKISLPKLIPSMYSRYKNDISFYRRIYTILWAGSYKYGWDQWNGTHLWVDIATSRWTPVYSIWRWRVVYVWYKRWWWKVVVIQHKINGRYVYSNYAHLNKIFVRFNQIVDENTKIWEVGHSWNSYWNHLHFQIDTNQSISKHPFWFRKCAYGKSIFNIVNHTYCLSELQKNTLDPLAFLSSNGAIIKYVKKWIKHKLTKKISRKHLISYETIEKKLLYDFLKTHKFYVNFKNSWVYYLWKYGEFTISLKDKNWRAYKDLLPKDLEIIYDKSFYRSFSTDWIKIIDATRKITFLPRKTWTTKITIKMWKYIIFSKTIRIIRYGDYVIPKYAKLFTVFKNPYIWAQNWGLNIFKDRNYVNIVRVPFKGYFYLTSNNKSINFCKFTSKNLHYLRYFYCNSYNSKKTIKFSYKDTYFWLLIFKFYSNNFYKSRILVKDSKWKILSFSRTLRFLNVKLTNYKTNYKYDIYQACKKWLCLNILDNGYVWNKRKLNLKNLKFILSNFLKNLWKIKNFRIYKTDKKRYISRMKFIRYIFWVLKLKVKNYRNFKLNYIDISWLSKRDKNYIVYLTKIWFKWKDRFAKYHFQPNKIITMEEALYLLNFLLNKYLQNL